MSEQTSTTTEELHVEATPSDYALLYEEQKAETDRLRTVLAASRIGADNSQKDVRRPAITAQRLTAMLGQHQVNQMTRAERLQALGLDPATVDDALLTKCFGRGANSSAARELYNTNASRYLALREAAILTGRYAT